MDLISVAKNCQDTLVSIKYFTEIIFEPFGLEILISLVKI